MTMTDGAPIPEKSPSSVNQPSSGTYGEKADLAKLKAQLPAPEGSAPIGSGPQTPQNPGMAVSSSPIRPSSNDMSSPVPGLPSALFNQPTQRPGEPATTMPSNTLAQDQPSSLSGQQQRLAILDALANDPTRSEQTRAWAKIVIGQLTT